MKLNINGVERQVATDWQDETLLTVLRDHLGLSGTRFSCGIGQCGACLVHVEGSPVSSCLMSVKDAANKNILTIEGLAAEDGTLHPLQQAWIDESVPQCGYCQSGQIMAAAALIAGKPDASSDDIDQAMSGNICRCGCYPRIKAAIASVADNSQSYDATAVEATS